MVIKGWAATGKSTIAKGIARLIGEVNVGYIASNCEEQWALASVQDKSMWMCLELKSGFRLPTGVMQSMTSGETVVINEKFKTAFDVVWTIQGLLVGNELPLSWTADAMNALVRRVVPFPFDVPPRTQDRTVAPRFFANLAKFFVRITRRYLAMCIEVGDRPLDDVLPRRLRDASDDFKKRAAPLLRFLDSSKNDEGDFEIAPLEVRIAILRELLNQGVNSAILSTDKATLDAEHGEQMGVIVNVHMPSILQQWCVPMNEVKTRFQQWMQLNGDRKLPNLDNAETYKPTARELKLGVASGVTTADGKNAKLHWYGIRLKHAASVGGGRGHGSGMGLEIPYGMASHNGDI